MDYEKEYKSLIEELRQARNDERKGYTFCSVIDGIVPELKESEDERIYNLIYSSIKNDMSIGSPKNKELALAWLEKQKEQKPAGWSKEDEKTIQDAIALLTVQGNDEVADRLTKLPKVKSYWKPSEEQMCELNWASKLSPVLESLYNDLKNCNDYD